MTAQQKLMQMILAKAYQFASQGCPALDASNIGAAWLAASDDEMCDYLQDAKNEIRCSGVATGLPCDYSRHYESKAVAAKAFDGSWVGWTYFYGGGKHGEPQEMDWIDFAYNVNCVEQEKLVVVREFSKVIA